MSDALGLVNGRPHLASYDERWPVLFERLHRRLLEELGDRILSVHHVGSTAVPGLTAKPILDVMIAVESLHRSLECVPILAGLGFEHAPEDDIGERHYFRGHRGALRTHHVSLAEPGSAYFVETLAFRDALRSSGALRREYADLKADIIRRHRPGEPLHLGKTDFVRRVLASARQERSPPAQA